MTLGEAQTKALQILNTYSIEGIPNPDSYNNQADAKIRLKAFANDAQMEIARTNGRIVREFKVTTFENDMSYSTTLEEVQIVHGGETIFTGKEGHSYSLNLSGSCTVAIAVAGTVVDTVTLYPTSGQFVVVKGTVSNPTNDVVTITVNSNYDYMYKNVAIFKNKYPDNNSVREYSSANKVTVPVDLIAIIQGRVYFNNQKSSQYQVYGRDIYIENDTSGEWKFNYYARPQEITSDTPLSYEFEVPAQTHNAIPYKMAYLIALDISGVSASVLTAIKNEYAQQISSVIEEPQYRTAQITNVYGV